jgi:predicted nucleic-acid-binding protein
VIAFDTNVLVRLMVEDDEAQTRSARDLLVRATEGGERVLVTDIALCELEWVLEAAYHVPRESILRAIQALCADDRFALQDPARTAGALSRYQAGRGDLSDYLLGLTAHAAGATTTYTFDRGLRTDEQFTVIR